MITGKLCHLTKLTTSKQRNQRRNQTVVIIIKKAITPAEDWTETVLVEPVETKEAWKLYQVSTKDKPSVHLKEQVAGQEF